MRRLGCVVLGWVVAIGSTLAMGMHHAGAATPQTPADAARGVNETLAGELTPVSTPAKSQPAARADDETFIRRATLDLVGRAPTPAEVTAFVLDPAEDKRPRLIKRLLGDEAFGRNWARYWRDVIMYRASDPRAAIASAPLERYLADQFNRGTSWKDITKSFITATGDVRENGQTALIMAQQGQAEEVTAEVSRVFMGVQIQCAQCHDHPTDRWKRAQFHEMAAFFPRVRVRPVRGDGNQRSFEVVSVDRQTRFRGGQQGQRGTIEHYMSDLDKPSERGTLMTPKFFATGRTLDTGTADKNRRETLADWLTSSRNPWFTRAFVNRLWAEMVGEGFYEPIDDLGPDRACSAPKTLDLLAEQFTVNQYDIKWLFETIAATDAYQRASRKRRDIEGTPFVANCNQRLRGDQLYTVITQVLGIADSFAGRTGRPMGPYGGGGLRAVFNQTFGYDPSTPREEVAGSIPQALFMMNSPLLQGGIDGRRPGSLLGQLLRDIDDDQTLVSELYLRCLSRAPKPSEMQTCLEHLGKTPDRREAFEDLLWALVNTTEFLHRK